MMSGGDSIQDYSSSSLQLSRTKSAWCQCMPMCQTTPATLHAKLRSLEPPILLSARCYGKCKCQTHPAPPLPEEFESESFETLSGSLQPCWEPINAENAFTRGTLTQGWAHIMANCYVKGFISGCGFGPCKAVRIKHSAFASPTRSEMLV